MSLAMSKVVLDVLMLDRKRTAKATEVAAKRIERNDQPYGHGDL
jgi:hypothetical protein